MRDVKPPVCVGIHECWRRDGAMQIVVAVVDAGGTVAEVTAVGHPGSAFFVFDAWAEKRWGPFAYDVMMERATEVGLGLVPDWKEVSPDARAVWRYYAYRRRDVTKRAADGLLVPGTKKRYRPLFREAGFIYRKTPKTLVCLEKEACGCGTYTYGKKTADIGQRPLL